MTLVMTNVALETVPQEGESSYILSELLSICLLSLLGTREVTLNLIFIASDRFYSKWSQASFFTEEAVSG